MTDIFRVFQAASAMPTSALKSKLLVSGLTDALHDTHELMVLVHGCHWNATGPGASALSHLAEDQYHELSDGAEALAVRLRVFGADVAQTGVEDAGSETGGAPILSTQELIDRLFRAHETLAERLEILADLARTCDDALTMAGVVERARAHRKAAADLSRLRAR